MITLDELSKIEYLLDQDKIWDGMDWVQHPYPAFKYDKVLTIIRRELDEIRNKKERTNG